MRLFSLRKIRRSCYRLGSLLGWINATASGPAALLRRTVNVFIGRNIVRRIWWRRR